MGVSPFLFGLLIFFAGGALGRAARTSWRPSSPKQFFRLWPNQIVTEAVLDRVVLDTSVGLGLLSLLMFGLNASHQAHPADFFVIALICAVVIGAPALSWEMLYLLGPGKPSRLPWWKTILWVLALACLAVYVLTPALAPPSASDWDSLAYHLAIPKLYLQHGGFYYIDFASHSNFPMLVEMLYLPALSMNEPAGAKMVHYLYGVLLVLAVVMLVRKHFSSHAGPPEHPEPVEGRSGGSKAAPLAALAIAGIPMVMWEATSAYIDLATALYTVVAVYLLLDYLDKPALKPLIWCGVAAGSAASTKMTGLALIPMLVVWLLIDRLTLVAALRRRQPGTEAGHYGQVIRHALTLAGVGLLVCSPWYVKSIIYTGNPVYPFFYSIFGGKDWTQELAQTYAGLQRQFGVGHDFASFMFLPYDLTFRWTEFCDRGQPWLLVGPILLVALPLLCVARNLSRKLRGLICFFLAQIVIWFLLTEQSRYLIPSFALLAVIIAAIAYSDERLRFTRPALYVVFGATAVLGVWVMMPFVRSAAPVVFGSETTDRYLTRTLPIYGADRWINEHAPVRAKVALFGDTRGFYLDRDYVWADWGHNKRFTRSFAPVDWEGQQEFDVTDRRGDMLSPKQFHSYLKSQGITYALVNFRNMTDRDAAVGTYKLIYLAIDNGDFIPGYRDKLTDTGVYRIR